MILLTGTKIIYSGKAALIAVKRCREKRLRKAARVFNAKPVEYFKIEKEKVSD